MAAPTQGRFLACDIGNTHICFGIFTGRALETAWRIRTDPKETEDELKAAILQIITFNGIRREDVGGAIVASVVPPLTETMVGCLQTLFGVKVIVVGPGIKTGVSVLMENPREVGADRIVNAIAASTKYPGGSIVVDTGTATTFDCISPAAEYLGGAIAPGIAISSEALFLRAAKLPKIEIAKPPRCVGKSTVESMQSGIFYGYLGQIEYIVHHLKKERGMGFKVVATGGLSAVFKGNTSVIDILDPDLTLKGLNYIYRINRL